MPNTRFEETDGKKLGTEKGENDLTILGVAITSSAKGPL